MVARQHSQLSPVSSYCHVVHLPWTLLQTSNSIKAVLYSQSWQIALAGVLCSPLPTHPSISVALRWRFYCMSVSYSFKTLHITHIWQSCFIVAFLVRFDFFFFTPSCLDFPSTTWVLGSSECILPFFMAKGISSRTTHRPLNKYLIHWNSDI